MRIGLIDVDGHNFPNLALMKISAWHKLIGDDVEWWNGFSEYDKVYMSKVFDDTYSNDVPEPFNAKEIVKGGTGYGLENKLPYEIEHMFPDYSIYGYLTNNTAYGFLTRGCPRMCNFCIVGKKEGIVSKKVSDLSEWWNGQKNIKLLDPNILACNQHLDLLEQLAKSMAFVDFTQGLDVRLLTEKNIEALNEIRIKRIHFAWDFMSQSKKIVDGLKKYDEKGKIKDPRRRCVYVLTNYNTTIEDDLYRVYTIRDLGYDPYVMVFDKPNAPTDIRKLQRWCNNRIIFKTVKNFDEYIGGRQNSENLGSL